MEVFKLHLHKKKKMENSILNIQWEAGGSLPINAKLAYRVDQGSTASRVSIVYAAMISGSGPHWQLELDFNKNITEDDKLALEKALIRIQQNPSSLINFKMPSEAVLKTEVPISNISNN